ncbi:MAG: Dihydrolipoamide acetyltransferase component of pyruvate dehydrogenase complex, partial [Pseudomonadota bacterium]
MALIEVKVPDIGDFDEVSVIELLVKPGDTVKPEQSLITVESDKASMEIPSSAAGVVKELRVKLGDKVAEGSVVVMLEAEGAAAAAPAPAPAPVAAPVAAAPSPVLAPATATPAPAVASPPLPERASPTAALAPHEPSAPGGALPHASPSVRKFARELGVPLEEVKGSGPKGRVTQEDVQAFTKSVMNGTATTRAAAAQAPAGGGGEGLGLLPWPKVDFTKFGPIERKDLSRIKKISAANLHRNWVMIPHVT